MFAANSARNKAKSKARHPRQVHPVSLRRASRILGYTVGHLSRVIKGERISPPTLRAYAELCRREGIPFRHPSNN
jgi:hypothetical protein